jgi:VanZ family protein
VLRFFWPAVTNETISRVQTVVRKTGHVSEYAVLAILLWRARESEIFPQRWNARSAFIAATVCFLYAMTDEFHQSFVPTREASVWDVMIDTTGAVVGLALIRQTGKFRRGW